MNIAIGFFILFLATWTEVYRDRSGDAHPNSDWKLRGALCLISAVIASLIRPINNYLADLLRYTLVAILLFTSIFPYWINYVHLKNKVVIYFHYCKIISFEKLTLKQIWYHINNHLSRTAWPDKTKWWIWLGPNGRLVVNLIILVLSIIIFFI